MKSKYLERLILSEGGTEEDRERYRAIWGAFFLNSSVQLLDISLSDMSDICFASSMCQFLEANDILIELLIIN